MPRTLDLRRSLALTSVLVVATWGVAAGPASADPGSGHSQAAAHKSDNAHHPHGAQTKQNSDSKDTKRSPHHGQGHDHGQGPKGQRGHGGHGDPAGNNGTVKIAPLGEMDGIPNNSPHPGCDFQIEWYGFDEGADVISTVTFAMQAPTKDVSLTVDGPSNVFVGGDPATGAGTATGLDGTQAYSLSFQGAPHPKQGYHVKLTVATPHSKGNDTKTKVFWVAPCETPTSGASSAPGSSSDDDTSTAQGGKGSTSAPAAEGQGKSSDLEVLGTQASGDSSKTGADQANAGSAGVPTAVDAGENSRSAADWIRSPLPVLVILLGALLAAAAFVTRRRSSARTER